MKETSVETAVSIDGLRKVYRSSHGSSVEALRNIDLTAQRGEFVSIVGPSGCGKSTLLRIVAGLIRPSQGSVMVHDNPVVGPNPDVGMVFQSAVLLNWRSVIDNILLPIEVKRLDKRLYRERAKELIHLTGLSGFENTPPYELSGGMQQRVSICRALITEPYLTLLDEPFGALDAFTRDQMNLELLRIWRGERKDGTLARAAREMTILFITHSIAEAVFLSDRVAVMSFRPGTIVKVFDVPFERPREMDIISNPQFGDLVLEIRSHIQA